MYIKSIPGRSSAFVKVFSSLQILTEIYFCVFSLGENDGRIRLLHPNINPLSANITKWSNALKQFLGNLPMYCLSVFDHFVILVLKGLRGDPKWFRS